jgi:hypothetical protein
VHFCSWFVQCIIEDEIDLQLTCFSDEPWFYFQGKIYTKNNCYWNSQNPHLTHKVWLHPVKVGVWHAVRAKMIARPVFFNGTINCESYVQVILWQLFPELTEEESFYGWFQQDSATAHIACMSMQAFSDIFRDRNISTGIWQAHSPDINPYDILFCGSL